ncbi:MAG: DUF3025 domain-containing protein [gamma proteobacterium symbiont of Taylorina sp.]|nr:DUF3025 domain-containing protein [gamma proteobacterium symbiont of Taylorina sp.]
MAKNIINQWDPDFLNSSLIFSDLNILLKNTPLTDWPGCSGLLALLDKPVILSSGQQLDMRVQDKTLPFPEMGYEERVYKKGIISTREQNWHDLFNAFIWLLFPKTKILLNSLHMQELQRQPGKKRTPARDAITHLDESGIIIASSDENLINHLKNHQWQTLFVQSRSCWSQQGNNSHQLKNNSIGAFVFGHGMYEKALKPFIGFTGKAYCIKVDNNFYQNDKMTQYAVLDNLLCNDLQKKRSLSNSDHLSPIPILGVPGWSEENKDPDYYNNKAYFRAKL